jgi:hypothetical protein
VGRLPTTEADIFNSGLVLQSNIITIFILGSIVIATLPQITKIQNQPNTSLKNDSKTNQERVSIYLSWCMFILSGCIFLLCLCLIIFAEPVLRFFNPQLMISLADSNKLSEFILFNKIALIGPIVFGLKSLLGVFLNVKKEYFVYSLEGILNNFGSLLGLTIGYSFFGIVGASLGALLGLILAFIAFWWDSYRFGFRFSLGWFEGLESYLWVTLWLYLPRLLVYSNIRASETMVSALSSSANGQISAFQYALDIQGIFLGVILAVGTVFLPNLAQVLVQKGQGKQFWSHLFKYLKISFVLSLIGAIITAFGTPLALILFQFLAQAKQSSFLADSANVKLVSELAIFAAIALVFQSVAEILSRYFTAVEKVWQSIIASVSGNVLAVIFAFSLKSSSFGAGEIAGLSLILNSIVFALVLGYFTFLDWRHAFSTEDSHKINLS